MLHILFWALAFALLALATVCGLGTGIGALPAAPGASLTVLSLLGCALAACLADRTTR